MYNKHNETKQRFAIKKYTFGVASALVGVFFFGAANAAQAEETTTPAATTVAPATTAATTAAPAATAATTAAPAATTTAAPATTDAPPVAEEAPKASSIEGVDATTLPMPGLSQSPTVSGKGELTQADAKVDIPMTDANGATVYQDPSLTALLQQGYKLDPKPNRVTFAITEPSGNDAIEGTNAELKAKGLKEIYYVTSFDASRENEGVAKNAYVTIFDKETHTVLEEIILSEANKDYTSKVFDDAEAAGVKRARNTRFVKSDAEQNGVFRSTVFHYSDDALGGHVLLFSLTEKNAMNADPLSWPQVKDTTVTTQTTFYVTNNPDGSSTQLAKWDNIDWAGQAYTASGVRQFEGYELVRQPKPEEMTGILGVRPVVGFKWDDTPKGGNESGGRYSNRVGEVVNEQGGIILRIVSAANKEMTEDVRVEFTSDVIYPPGHVFPDGTVSTGYATNGTATLNVNGVDLPGARYNYQNGPDGALRGYRLPNSAFSVQKDVYYVYEPTGKVTVHYVDTEGNVLRGSVVDTENKASGTAYDTTDNKPERIQNDGVTYYLKETATSNVVGGKEVYKTNDYTTANTETGTVEKSTFKNVTYVYERAGQVIVDYVLNGTQDAMDPVYLKDSVLDTRDAKGGTAFDTAVDNKPETIVGADGKLYKLVAGPAGVLGAETGEVVAGQTKQVTYLYDLVKTGDVVVNYVDEAGNVIATKATDTPVNTEVDKAYDTTDLKPETITTANGSIYELVPEKTVGTEKGKVVEGTTEITYVYRQITGDVVVNYVDEAGNVIAPKVTDTPISRTGAAYDTAVDNKPTTITTQDGKTYTLVPEKTQGNETGTVVPGTTEITYVYKEVKGDVVVNYVDKEGNVLQAPVTDTPESSTGVAYDTTDNKPETIVSNGKTYKLVPTLTKGTENGKVVEGTTEITYVYEEVKGDVVVNYVDEAGNVLQTKVLDTPVSSVGTTYDTTDYKPNRIVANGKTYELIPTATKGNETGTVVEGTTEITYVYKEVSGNVVVNYVDREGNVLQAPVTDTATTTAGTAYDTTDNKPATIVSNGKTYKLVPTLTKGTENGKVVEGTTEITYVYEEVKGDVVVNFVDEAGNVLQTKVLDTPVSSVGTTYDTTDYKPTTLVVNGKTYELIPTATKGNETGTVVEGTTEVTYVYKEVVTPKGSVVVNYVDEAGNVLQAPATDTKDADVNTPYNTADNNMKPTTLVVNGKTYELVPAATKGTENGTVTEGTTEVTYVYKEVVAPKPGSVVVNYVDEAGNVLQTPVTDSSNVVTGTDYDTTDYKPTTIVVNGKTYELVPTATKGTEKGQVVEGTTEVTYVYKEVAPKVGTVVVNYVDEAGNVLQTPVTDSSKVTPGTDYDTTDYKPTTIVVNGKTYELVPTATKGTEKGQVAEGTTEVTYVYKEVTKVATVTTKHVDTEGNVVAPGQDGTQPKTNVNGYVYVTSTVDANGNTTHVYRPVKTTHVDVNGKEVAPGTKGTTGTVSVDGYVFVETKTTPEGDTIHVYRPVQTIFVDEKGNVLAPGKDGQHPFANVDGYVLVETKTTPEGDTIHVYRPVQTIFVDEKGNVLAPGKDGQHPFANVPGYTLVDTKIDENGNVTHVYRPVENKGAGVLPTPTKPSVKATAKKAKAKSAKKAAQAGALPKTSATTETNSALPAGLAAALAAAGLVAARRRNEK